MRKQTEIFSIFGQIESAAAEHMIRKGAATKIPQEAIPAEALYNERDEKALFAVIVPYNKVAEFERIIRNLRA